MSIILIVFNFWTPYVKLSKINQKIFVIYVFRKDKKYHLLTLKRYLSPELINKRGHFTTFHFILNLLSCLYTTFC